VDLVIYQEGRAVPTKVRALHNHILNLLVQKKHQGNDKTVDDEDIDANNLKGSRCKSNKTMKQQMVFLHCLFLMQSMQTLSVFLCRIGLTKTKTAMRKNMMIN
jgi:hypothetical protein